MTPAELLLLEAEADRVAAEARERHIRARLSSPAARRATVPKLPTGPKPPTDAELAEVADMDAHRATTSATRRGRMLTP